PTHTHLYTLSLHDALPISPEKRRVPSPVRPSTLQSFSANLSVSLNWFSYDLNLSFQFNSALISGRLLDSVNQLKHIGRGRAAVRSEEHTSELQSLAYLVCR